MDALVMAGGQGTRLAVEVEKPLFEVGGVPLIDRVLAALGESNVEETYVATTPATPATRAHVDAPVIETPGAGYVEDLSAALEDPRLDEPVLTVGADLPLLAGPLVDRIVGAHERGSLTVAVPVRLKAALGVSVDARLPEREAWAPTGLNVVGGDPETRYWSWDARLAVNVNRPVDARVAESLASPRKN